MNWHHFNELAQWLSIAGTLLCVLLHRHPVYYRGRRYK